MKQWERWLFNGLNIVVAATGLAYMYMRYLLPSDDPFAVVNHPWQVPMLALHVVAAPLVIFAFGTVLRSHILKKLVSKSQPDRRSGWVSLISFSAMALSGYLLQVVSSVALLDVMVVVHIATGVVFVIGYGAHLVIGWRLLWTTDPASTPGTDLPDTAGFSL